MATKAASVWNITRNSVLVSQLEWADNVFTRLKGLMGRPGLPQGHGLWIVPCHDIHSCFMRFEFDALFIGKDDTVLHLVERMKPWGMSPWIKGARGVLELPGGVIAQTSTQVGDQVAFR